MNNLQRAIEEVADKVLVTRKYGKVEGSYFKSEHNLIEFLTEESAKVCALFEDLDMEIVNNLTCITIRYKYAQVTLLWMNTKWVSLEVPVPFERVLIVPKQNSIRTYVLRRIEWLLKQ